MERASSISGHPILSHRGSPDPEPPQQADGRVPSVKGRSAVITDISVPPTDLPGDWTRGGNERLLPSNVEIQLAGLEPMVFLARVRAVEEVS